MFFQVVFIALLALLPMVNPPTTATLLLGLSKGMSREHVRRQVNLAPSICSAPSASPSLSDPRFWICSGSPFRACDWPVASSSALSVFACCFPPPVRQAG